MAESAAQRAEAVQTATRGLDPAAQVAAVAAVIDPPDAETTKTLWIILVSGLIGLLVIALGGLIYLIADDVDGSDVVLTVFSSVLTGLLGLFASSPVKATRQ
jgi:hypothetical protein